MINSKKCHFSDTLLGLCVKTGLTPHKSVASVEEFRLGNANESCQGKSFAKSR